MPQPSRAFRPVSTRGMPGIVAPITPPEASSTRARYHQLGAVKSRCGSLASSDPPAAERYTEALCELAGLAGLTPEECVAIGDGDNDTAMLAAAGMGIAMANGSANAKAAADRTGPDAEPHGVADLCRELWPEAF